MAVSWHQEQASWDQALTESTGECGGISEVDDETFARAIREGRAQGVPATTRSAH